MVANLKLLRKRKGVSQQQLAEVIGSTQQSVNKYENHKVEPDIDTLIRIANFFDTTVDYLIGNTDKKSFGDTIEIFSLNFEEADFITRYRLLNENEKKSVLLIINNYLNKNDV